MRSAVAQLRLFLDSGEAAEPVYQKWCETHSWAFGNAYVVRDDVREISTGDTLDLLLPNVIAGYRDIVELKRPDMQVLVYDREHKNFYFSSEVSKAIGQCHRYLDVLHEVAANGLRDRPEVVAYHPRATIVIGRSQGWGEPQLRALHGLNRRLSGLTVMTYDHLLAQGERLIEALGSRRTSSSKTDRVDHDTEDPFGDDSVF
ncbi:MAG: Shedu anti-phage system protein SduA domain-containing protein [Pyrinomonadaceae bacterium]